jgi:predicted O-methyltransferase YrrM
MAAGAPDDEELTNLGSGNGGRPADASGTMLDRRAPDARPEEELMQPEAAPANTRLRHSVTHRVPLSVRQLPYRAVDRLAALRDQRRLRADRPDLVAAMARPHDDSVLRPAYDRYVTEISTWKWAVSWPTARLLDTLCEALRPRKVLDLGSGFSTYVLTSWAQRTGAEVEIVSVDDSVDWLAKTRAFLAGHGLDAQLLDAAELPSLPDAAFDLAFDDIGRSEDRANVLDTVIRVMAPGAVVVLDDMNVRGYRRQVRTRLDTVGWPLYSVRGETIDAKGRFAMLTTAPRP